MAAVDSSFVILPRFTTLVGATTFTTLPMDVSAYGGAQFQVWRGAFRVKAGGDPPTFAIYLQELLDCQNWVLGPDAAGSHVVDEGESEFFSYDFRLRWFRLAVEITGSEPIVSCWAEGLLRDGGGGLWNLADPRTAVGAIDINRFGPASNDWLKAGAARGYSNALALWNATGQPGLPPTPPPSLYS